MRKHIIKSSALMRQFKTNADLFCLCLINRFRADDNKTGDILSIMTDVFRKNGKTIEFSCLTACHSRLTGPAFFFYFFG